MMTIRKHLATKSRGASHPRAKLTEDDVRDIKQRSANGATTNDLLAIYPQIGPGALRRIKRGDSWGWVR